MMVVMKSDTHGWKKGSAAINTSWLGDLDWALRDTVHILATLPSLSEVEDVLLNL